MNCILPDWAIPAAVHICGQRSQLPNACLHSNKYWCHVARSVIALATNILHLKADIPQEPYILFLLLYIGLLCDQVFEMTKTLPKCHHQHQQIWHRGPGVQCCAMSLHLQAHCSTWSELSPPLDPVEWCASQWSPAIRSGSEVTSG